jgi:hypothetical protein
VTRGVSGIFTEGGGVSTQSIAASAKAMLPTPATPIGYVNGDRTKPVYIDAGTWYRLLDFIINVKLGGVAAPSVTDIASTITSVQEAVTTTVTTVNSVTETVVQNAAALDTVREVAQNNSLSGASQIPRIQRYPQSIA